MGEHIVFGSGPSPAKIMFLGARPGRDEIRTGRPFTGASGDLLWRLCPVGRDEIHVDNVCQDYSPYASTPTEREIDAILPDLRRRIEQVNPNVVVAFGAQALKALTGVSSIDKARGYVFESSLVPGLKVIPAWHPAHIIRGQYERRYILEADIRKGISEGAFPEIRRKKRTFLTNPNYRDTVDYIHALKDPVTVDIECPVKILDIINVIGLTDSPDYAMAIPLTWGRYSFEELEKILKLLQSAVFDKKHLNGQNIMFDVWRMERFLFRIKHIHFCTMLAHHLLWPEAGVRQKNMQGKDNFAGGHDLGFLTSFYNVDLPMYKDEGSTWNQGDEPDLQQWWEYNCKDVCGTHEIMLKEVEELREFHQEEYYFKRVVSMIRPCLAMQERGIAIDWTKADSVKRRLKLEQDYLQLTLNHSVGFDLNVKSPPQMRYLIEDVLKMKSFKKTPKGKPSTDEETLRTLAYGSDHAPIFLKVLDVRERRTLISSFFQLETTPDGRYGAPYKIHGTDSGRLSCTSPKDLDGRKGPQLQNIPKAARKIFKASEGFVIIQGDYGRAEAMYVAYDAQEEKLIRLFEDPSKDLYMEVAADCLSKPVTEVDRDMERPCFKQTVLGANYGLGPRRYISVLRANKINIEDIYVRGITRPLKKAEFFLGKYSERFSKITEWQREIADRVRKTKVLHDSFGRRRFFMGSLRDPHTINIALSFRPQASVVQMTNTAVRTTYSQGYHNLLQVHDSLAIEVEWERFEEGWDALEKAMYCPLDMHGRTMIIPVDIQWGFNWGPRPEKDPKENPGGLRSGRVLASDLPALYREAREP